MKTEYQDAINAVAEECHAVAKSHGWWDGWWESRRPSDESIAAKLCLIHSEVSEALETIRSGEPYWHGGAPGSKPEGLGSELADIIIRTLDLAHGLGIDIGRRISVKMEYNETRPFRHGGKRL